MMQAGVRSDTAHPMAARVAQLTCRFLSPARSCRQRQTCSIGHLSGLHLHGLAYGGTLPQQWRCLSAARSSHAPAAALQAVCASAATALPPDAAAAPAAGRPDTRRWTGAAIREAFLDFYEQRGHTRLPSASLVPDDPTVMLTIAGMLQFKPIFLGKEARKHQRATTTQKCVRTNDIENVGVTARHHTFFEMLGNFSFGDYFKAEAIQYAWELATQVYGLAPERIWVSVYKDDEEAYGIWRDSIGVPESRIQRLGAADNFWESGATGPCGPCTELYYDFAPDAPAAGASVEDDARFIEFYNLVFMESNKAADGSLTPLAARNIDTGLGLERMAQILQGVSNNYDTDLILPIVEAAAQLAGIDYFSVDRATQTSLRVIGDHTRAVVYLLSDGVLPSNVGRGYIVRRLLRRVIVKGALLGIDEVFTPGVAAAAVELSGGCDPEVAANADRIYAELRAEELRFRKTLAQGRRVLADMLQDVRSQAGAAQHGQRLEVPGDRAFLLYDSYGFPLEITAEIAAEEGVGVDAAGFEAAMAQQRQRSKDAVKVVDMTAGSTLGDLAGSIGPTSFVGYSQLEARGTVVALLQGGRPVDSVSAGDEAEVVLDVTPFYSEAGGQAGDTGTLRGDAQSGAGGAAATATVTNTQKAAGGSLTVHTVCVESGSLSTGQQVTAAVDAAARRRTRAHHTATHLLQAALRGVLGAGVAQQGSAVGPDRLRFDFSLPRGVKAEEIAEVERRINGWVAEGLPVETREMAVADAKAAGAIAMFGEKYGDTVRVLEVPGVSLELCGGTHVTATDQIGAFKVVSEAGVASGVRRIEAVVGAAAVEYLNSVDAVARGLAAQFKVPVGEVPARVAGLQEELKASQRDVAALQKTLAEARVAQLAGEAQTLGNGAVLLAAAVDGLDAKSLQDAAAQLQAQLGDPAAVFLATSPAAGKVAMAVAVSPAAVKGGLNAGKLVGGFAKLCGGGGGGRPNLAQAGGKNPEGIPDAVAAARTVLEEGLAKI